MNMNIYVIYEHRPTCNITPFYDCIDGTLLYNNKSNIVYLSTRETHAFSMTFLTINKLREFLT